MHLRTAPAEPNNERTVIYWNFITVASVTVTGQLSLLSRDEAHIELGRLKPFKTPQFYFLMNSFGCI